MKTVLIVEDDTSLQKILQERLQTVGITGIGVTTVKEATDYTMKNTPDLILLDIMLPGGTNGFDFLEQVRQDKKLKNIPVIVLTNLDTEKKTALDIGAIDYLVKPTMALDDVITKIQNNLK